jgi:hypothetical protein
MSLVKQYVIDACYKLRCREMKRQERTKRNILRLFSVPISNGCGDPTEGKNQDQCGLQNREPTMVLRLSPQEMRRNLDAPSDQCPILELWFAIHLLQSIKLSPYVVRISKVSRLACLASNSQALFVS